MRARGVVVGDPGADEPASLIEIDEQALVEKLVAHAAVERLDEAVLHRPAWRDVVPIDAMILRPHQHGVGGELSAIVRHDHLGFAARRNNHGELASNAFARDRCVGDCRQAFTRDVVHDVEDAKAPAVGELVVDEVERPARVDLSLDQDRCACPDRSAPGSALANCQPFLAVYPVDAVDARRLSLFPQQNEQPSIAEPASSVGKVAQTGAQLNIRRPARAIADRLAIGSNERQARRSLICKTLRR
jgi:hypothetical protein